MAIIKSITSFPVLTLPSNTVWKPAHLFSSEEKEIFLIHRHKIKHSIMKSRLYSNPSEKTLENQSCFYLLIKNNEIIAWAEIQIYVKSFRTALVLFGVIGDAASIEMDILNPVISSSFLILDIDILRLVPTQAHFTTYNNSFEKRSIWSISTNPSRTLQPYCVYDIRRDNWINSQEINRELKALKARIDRLKAENKAKEKASSHRRGLLSRLLRPKVDDALF